MSLTVISQLLFLDTGSKLSCMGSALPPLKLQMPELAADYIKDVLDLNAGMPASAL